MLTSLSKVNLYLKSKTEYIYTYCEIVYYNPDFEGKKNALI